MKNKPTRSTTPSKSSGKIEWFSGSRAALDAPAISIAHDGRLRFNAALVRSHKLQAYGGVQLGYDARGPRILFRFTKAATASSLKLRVHDGGTVANAKGFFTKHELDLRKCARRYTPVAARHAGAGQELTISLRRIG